MPVAPLPARSLLNLLVDRAPVPVAQFHVAQPEQLPVHVPEMAVIRNVATCLQDLLEDLPSLLVGLALAQTQPMHLVEPADVAIEVGQHVEQARPGIHLLIVGLAARVHMTIDGPRVACLTIETLPQGAATVRNLLHRATSAGLLVTAEAQVAAI